MVAKAANQNEWAHDCLFFLDLLARSNYAGQMRLYHWLLRGGPPPAAIEGREQVYRGMNLRELRQFRFDASRLIQAPSGGAAVQK